MTVTPNPLPYFNSFEILSKLSLIDNHSTSFTLFLSSVLTKGLRTESVRYTVPGVLLVLALLSTTTRDTYDYSPTTTLTLSYKDHPFIPRVFSLESTSIFES